MPLLNSPFGMCHSIPPPNLASVTIEYSKSHVNATRLTTPWLSAFVLNSLAAGRQDTNAARQFAYEWLTCSLSGVQLFVAGFTSGGSILQAQGAQMEQWKHQNYCHIEARGFLTLKKTGQICFFAAPRRERFIVDLNDLLICLVKCPPVFPRVLVNVHRWSFMLPITLLIAFQLHNCNA